MICVPALVACTAAAVLSTGAAHGASVVKVPLAATASAQRAKERAVLALRAGAFTVRAQGLTPNHPFDVVVGGIKVGGFTTKAHGAGKGDVPHRLGEGGTKRYVD